MLVPASAIGELPGVRVYASCSSDWELKDKTKAAPMQIRNPTIAIIWPMFVLPHILTGYPT